MSNIKGLLLRVGIDQTYGAYNAPINPLTNDYMYMPIPQGDKLFKPGMRTSYDDLRPSFHDWCQRNTASLVFKQELEGKSTHLDPDFYYLTYGDPARQVTNLTKGDFIAFFASFKPIFKCDNNLVYALFGIMFVDSILKVSNVSKAELNKNAHTRLMDSDDINNHLVVFADPCTSGRFRQAIPIGEFRSGSYRVTNTVLDQWGNIDVKDGFIQRSVRPPWFLKPDQFIQWLALQKIQLINNNW